MIRLHHIAAWYGEGSQLPPRAPMPGIRRVRSRQTRWLPAFAIWLVALTTRWLLDDIVNSGPFLTFLPAIALVTLFCGRLPALVVIAAAAVACDYLWLPPPGFAMEWPTTPVSLGLFILIGVFELVLVDWLYLASRGNVEQRSRLEHSLRLRQTLFEELRHRIANQLNVIAAML